MFIDYKKIKNLIIEELISNNRLSYQLLISNIQRTGLINTIIDNIEIEKDFNNDVFIYDIYLLGQKLFLITSQNDYEINDDCKYRFLKTFIYNNPEGYYALMDIILDCNSCNLIDNKIDPLKINLHSYLRNVSEDENSKNKEKIKSLKIKKEVYYLKTLIGIYETEEDYNLNNLINYYDFGNLSRKINKTITVRDINDLKIIAEEMSLYNERYKKALRREKHIICKVKKI